MSYQSYFQGEGFKPSRLSKDLSGLTENFSRTNAQMSLNANAIQVNNSIQEKNAQESAKTLSQLAELSQTALNITQEVVKKNVEDQKVNETYDALVGDYEPDSDTEDEQKEVAEREIATEVNADANELEAAGELGASNAIRTQTPEGVVANQNLSERGRLMRAQTAYAPWMVSFLRSDNKFRIGGQSMTVAQAMASGDAALMAAAQGFARAKFIETYGLQNVSKRRFVKALKGTILNTDASIASGFMSEAVKAERAEKQRGFTEQGFQLGQSGQNLGAGFRDLADQMYLSGAYVTRGQANEAALKATIAGLVNTGDVEGLRALALEPKIAGNAGTVLGREYGSLFAEAESKAVAQRQQAITQASKDIKADMYRELSQLGPDATPDQRSGVVERAAVALEANGDYEAARNLRQKQDNLRVDAGSDLNAANLQQGIFSGTVTALDIQQAELRGDITSAQANSLNADLKAEQGSNSPDDKEAKDIVKDWAGRFSADFLAAAGLKRDPQGVITKSGQTSLISGGEAKIVVGQMERDLNLAVNTVLSQNPGVTGLAKSQLIQETVQDWYQQNVGTSTGKYYFQDIQQRNQDATQSGYTDAQKQRFTNLVNSPAERLKQSIPSVAQPLDFTALTRNGSPLEDNYRKLWNPLRGDKLFPEDVLMDIREKWQNGEVDPRLTRYSSQLGMSPLELLNQQSAVYRQPGFNFESQSSNAPLPVGNPSLTADYLVTMGLPRNSANFLSRYMSFSNRAEVQQLMTTMRDVSPESYAVFNNKYATPRQLRAAVDALNSGSGGRDLSYRTGNIGPTSTGPHLDVKQVGGGRFDLTTLDDFVEVDDEQFGTVSLSELRRLTNNVGDSWDEHYARGSHGIDVGTADATNVFVKNGAQVIGNRPTQHGTLTTIELPDGRKFTFLHGRGT